VNTDAPWPDADEASSRVLKIQTKLHQWASGDPTVGSTTSTTSSVTRLSSLTRGTG
jgi:hypothetical protein